MDLLVPRAERAYEHSAINKARSRVSGQGGWR